MFVILILITLCLDLGFVMLTVGLPSRLTNCSRCALPIMALRVAPIVLAIALADIALQFHNSVSVLIASGVQSIGQARLVFS